MEGSVQRDGDRIRVNAQWIDAIGGQHVWADRYDRDLNDLFAVRTDIAVHHDRLAEDHSGHVGSRDVGGQ